MEPRIFEEDNHILSLCISVSTGNITSEVKHGLPAPKSSNNTKGGIDFNHINNY